ncbi:MAG: bifunctional 4-hydroxy-2-oxoglutarate aldolase/2-dehydro-3-deoxy-phosphogluconate aldolase [Pseudoxanthomonas sp.]
MTSIAEHQRQAEKILRGAGILPVVTVHTLEQARRVSAALLKGGLPAIELTLRTPVAMDALRMLKQELPDIGIGMGTVVAPRQIEECVEAGADFLVTPGASPAMAKLLAQAPLPVVPGGATPSEFLALMELGFRACKLFPANAAGGMNLVKGLAPTLPELKLCPTGGMNEDNAADFLKQPNVACIGGSWMVPGNWIEAGEWDKVEAASARAAEIVRKARG